jgi:hypothetical protein
MSTYPRMNKWALLHPKAYLLTRPVRQCLKQPTYYAVKAECVCRALLLYGAV